MVKFCFECGAKNNGGRFCSECGTLFSTPASGNGDATSSSGGASSAGANAVAAQLNAQMHTTAFTGSAVTAAAPHVANAGFAAAKSAYKHQPVAAAAGVPMAVPVGPGSFNNNSNNSGNNRPSAFAAGNTSNGNAPPSAFRSSFKDNNNSDKAPAFRSSFSGNNSGGYGAAQTQTAGQAPAEPVPSAATGSDAQVVYESCVQTIRAARGGGNETGVKAFKQNCKSFGFKQIDVKMFYDSLVAELGANDTRNFVPNLSRLIPDDLLRKDLIEYNSRQRVSAFGGSAGSQPPPPPPYMSRYVCLYIYRYRCYAYREGNRLMLCCYANRQCKQRLVLVFERRGIVSQVVLG